ncbi:hypothetical protein HDU79_000404 [Rhizoclosmatium sp. JEL0117]|nr:hypothetical protein HDU79_000404 [Rhizoclosmatium sp. JEL0117]
MSNKASQKSSTQESESNVQNAPFVISPNPNLPYTESQETTIKVEDYTTTPAASTISHKASEKEEIKIFDSVQEELDYPDGGFAAWGVVFASFMAQFIVFGSIYSFGIYNDFYIKNGVGNSTQVSLIGGIGFIFITALAIVSGKLAQLYGFRKVVFLGTVLCSLGIFLASFSTALPLLVCTQGVLFGIGGCLIYFPAVSLPSQWFNKKRGLAQGIAASGSGLGGLAFSVAIQKLLDAVGLAWTLRSSALFFFIILLAINPLFKTRVQTSKSSKMDYTILKDPRFMFLLFAGFFANFALFVAVDFIPIFAQQKTGLSVADSATILSIYNGFGAVADTVFGRSNALIICMWVTVASYFSWIACTNYSSVAVFAAVNGTVGGGFWALLPVVLASYFGVEGLVSRVTLLYTALSIGNFCGPVLAAAIQEHYGLDWMVYYAGMVATAAALCGTVSRFLNEPTIFKKV